RRHDLLRRLHSSNRGTREGAMREIMVVYKVGKVREVREEVVLPATDRLIRRLSFRLKTTCGARSPEPSLLPHLVVVVQTDNLRGVAGQPKDVQPGVSAVDDVDEPAVVGRDVVRLDHLPANVRDALERAAPEIRVGGGGRDEERHVLWVVRVADVEGA